MHQVFSLLSKGSFSRTPSLICATTDLMWLHKRARSRVCGCTRIHGWVRIFVYKSLVTHMEFMAKKEFPDEKEDLLDVNCITLTYVLCIWFEGFHSRYVRHQTWLSVWYWYLIIFSHLFLLITHPWYIPLVEEIDVQWRNWVSLKHLLSDTSFFEMVGQSQICYSSTPVKTFTIERLFNLGHPSDDLWNSVKRTPEDGYISVLRKNKRGNSLSDRPHEM